MIDVPFADLDEAAKLGQTGKPHRNGFGGEGIEHHVHPPSAGQFHHGLGEVAAAGIDHAGGADAQRIHGNAGIPGAVDTPLRRHLQPGTAVYRIWRVFFWLNTHWPFTYIAPVKTKTLEQGAATTL